MIAFKKKQEADQNRKGTLTRTKERKKERKKVPSISCVVFIFIPPFSRQTHVRARALPAIASHIIHAFLIS